MAQEAAARWGVPSDMQLVGSWENFVYRVDLESGRVALRLTEPERRAKDALAAEVAFVQALHANECPVVEPVASRFGAFVEEIAVGGTRLRAVACVWLPGREPTVVDLTDRTLLRSWGQTIGMLHQAAIAVDGKVAMARPAWHQDGLLCRAHELLERAPVSWQQEFGQVVDWAATLTQEPETYGLIHADMHPANLILDGGKLSVLDFDDLCRGWFAFDLAVARLWLFDSGLSGLWPQLLHGYRTVRPFDQSWEQRVGGLVRLRRLQDYLLARLRLAAGDSPTISERLSDLEARLEVYQRSFSLV